MPNDSACVREERIRVGDAFDGVLLYLGDRRILVIGQPVDLIDAEHRVGFEKGNILLDLIAVRIGFGR